MTNTITVLKKKAAGKKGFTLVELVIVIAILAILAAIAIPTVSHLIAQANTSADASDAGTLTMAFKTTAAEVSAKPSVETDADTVTEVLTRNGMQVAILDPKTANNKYYFSDTSNKVICASSATAAATTGGDAGPWAELTATTAITYTNGRADMTP